MKNYRITEYNIWVNKRPTTLNLKVKELNPGAFNSTKIAQHVEKNLTQKLAKHGLTPTEFYHLIDRVYAQQIEYSTIITENGTYKGTIDDLKLFGNSEQK